MAYADELVIIRDNLVAELKGETAARRAMVAAGDPPPTTYSVGGKSTDWNGYLRAVRAEIKELNDQILAAGGDGGFGEGYIRGYT